MYNIYKLCNAGNKPKKTGHLPESQMQMCPTSLSVIVSAEIWLNLQAVALGMISLGQKKNNFNGNKSSNLV